MSYLHKWYNTRDSEWVLSPNPSNDSDSSEALHNNLSINQIFKTKELFGVTANHGLQTVVWKFNQSQLFKLLI